VIVAVHGASVAAALLTDPRRMGGGTRPAR
jgi:hypothetical protein